MSRYIRTDLAVEMKKMQNFPIEGLESQQEQLAEGVTVTRVQIRGAEAARRMGRPEGSYVTLEAPGLGLRDPMLDEAVSGFIAGELARLLPREGQRGPVLVVGLGNGAMAADSLGPRTVSRLMVTRHMEQLMPGALDERLRSVCTLTPGVLGVTGIETAEVVRAVAGRLRPAAVVAVDALASREMSHLGVTVQLCDSGIAPGSGVGNRRAALTRETVGCPVAAVGVPTVIAAATLLRDALERLVGEGADAAMEQLGREQSEPMIVTPRDVDRLVEDAARRLALGLNLWLHPGVTAREVAMFLH